MLAEPALHQSHHVGQAVDLLVALVRELQLESEVDVDADLEQGQRVELQLLPQRGVVPDPGGVAARRRWR